MRKNRVRKADRMEPTAQTLAKAKGCRLREIYQRGHIDGLQLEAAYEIAEAHALLISQSAMQGGKIPRTDRGKASLTPRQDRLVGLYVEWGQQLLQRRHIRAIVIVEMIAMERRCEGRDEIKLLTGALNDWRDRSAERKAPKRTKAIDVPRERAY